MLARIAARIDDVNDVSSFHRRPIGPRYTGGPDHNQTPASSHTGYRLRIQWWFATQTDDCLWQPSALLVWVPAQLRRPGASWPVRTTYSV